MQKIIIAGLLSLLLIGCSVPEPEESQIVDSNFTLAGKSSDDLLQACQAEISERVDRPDSYEVITDSEVFDKDIKDGRYRVFYRFYADMSDPDDKIVNKIKFDGYCKFNEEGESVGSGIISVVE